MTVSHRFSSDRGKLLENAVFLDLRRTGCEMYRLMDKKEVDFMIWKGTAPCALVNVCPDVADTDTKAREVNGLRRAMNQFNMDRGLVVTLNHSEILPVKEGTIEFLPYRIWALHKEKRWF
jgi:predicted AAA+ superfamily ATPase